MKALLFTINIIAYQGAWFACVLGAAGGHTMIGVAAALVVVLWHLYTASHRIAELRLVAITALFGAVFETLLNASGWVRMSPDLLLGWTPLWMVALWAAFATTLNVSLRSLRRRYVLSAALGAVGAPLAYYAGARLGALQIVHQLPATLAISLGWTLAILLLMRLACRLDGFNTNEAASV